MSGPSTPVSASNSIGRAIILGNHLPHFIHVLRGMNLDADTEAIRCLPCRAEEIRGSVIYCMGVQHPSHAVVVAPVVLLDEAHRPLKIPKPAIFHRDICARAIGTEAGLERAITRGA